MKTGKIKLDFRRFLHGTISLTAFGCETKLNSRRG